MDEILHRRDSSSRNELAAVYAIGERGWTVLDPEGRFDASPGGMEELYFVVDMVSFDLARFKERFYTPGLFARALARE